MSIDLPLSQPVRTADLSGRRTRDFSLLPTPEQLVAMAVLLEITQIRQAAFVGTLAPHGNADILLTARLSATVEQPCIVTLAPVTTHIDEDVRRLYVAGMPTPTESEAEMPEDETSEPMPQTLDLGAVMLEALALALPDYPRADGAEFGEAVFAGPNTEPLRDADLKPFAALAALKKGQDG